MREYLFKAKRKDNGEWVFGYYVYYEHIGHVEHIIITSWAQVYVNSFHVDPDTVCEYTGLPDKNGVKIFEKDIVKMRSYHGGHLNATVYFKGGKFAVNGSNYHFKDLAPNTYEVIGNVFDNPELLEVKQC